MTRLVNLTSVMLTYVDDFKFYTLYVFSLKTNLFHKIHLHALNVISIVLYHSGPTLGQVLCSCQDAFVVDASDYSGHLIRHLLSASEAFPSESGNVWKFTVAF